MGRVGLVVEGGGSSLGVSLGVQAWLLVVIGLERYLVNTGD